MNTHDITFYLVLICVAFIGCKDKATIADTPTEAFVCRVIYEDAVIEMPTGETISVELQETAESSALKLLKSLKSSIKIGLSPSAQPGLKARLYLVGKFTGEMSKPPPATSQPMPWKARPIFQLRGWVVVVPYTEYPQAPAYESQPRPRERNTLEATDFESPIEPASIHHDQKRGLYWIGIEPPDELPQPAHESPRQR